VYVSICRQYSECSIKVFSRSTWMSVGSIVHAELGFQSSPVLVIVLPLKNWVGINSGPGDQGTRGPTGYPALFGSLYTSQLVLGTSANPLFAHHDASHDVYQLEL